MDKSDISTIDYFSKGSENLSLLRQNMITAIKKIQQFQKEHSIKFAEWIAKEGWLMEGARIQNDSVWTKLQPHNNDLTLLGNELYERFLTELNNLK